MERITIARTKSYEHFFSYSWKRFGNDDVGNDKHDLFALWIHYLPFFLENTWQVGISEKRKKYGEGKNLYN